jgi:hypothetical protein
MIAKQSKERISAIAASSSMRESGPSVRLHLFMEIGPGTPGLK